MIKMQRSGKSVRINRKGRQRRCKLQQARNRKVVRTRIREPLAVQRRSLRLPRRLGRAMNYGTKEDASIASERGISRLTVQSREENHRQMRSQRRRRRRSQLRQRQKPIRFKCESYQHRIIARRVRKPMEPRSEMHCWARGKYPLPRTCQR